VPCPFSTTASLLFFCEVCLVVSTALVRPNAKYVGRRGQAAEEAQRRAVDKCRDAEAEKAQIQEQVRPPPADAPAAPGPLVLAAFAGAAGALAPCWALLWAPDLRRPRRPAGAQCPAARCPACRPQAGD